METKENPVAAEAAARPKDRSITLIVKAKELFGKTFPPSESQMDDCTALREDGGLESRYGQSNRIFETLVFMNRDVTWSIAASDPNGVDRGYRVRLDFVKHASTRGNPNFFDREELNVDPNTGTITGTISRNPNLPNKDDSYTINFIIDGPGVSREYILDPRLRISTRN